MQTQTQKAALRYERASSAHAAAKEMVYLAEEGLKKEGRCFDPAWQEMLNHATLRVINIIVILYVIWEFCEDWDISHDNYIFCWNANVV